MPFFEQAPSQCTQAVRDVLDGGEEFTESQLIEAVAKDTSFSADQITASIRSLLNGKKYSINKNGKIQLLG